MNKSESIKNLAIALAKFQGEVNNPSNTAENPFYRSKYAPLDTVLNTVRPILSKYGLSVVQAPSTEGNNITIATTLIHESGEYMEFPPLSLKMDKVTAQGAGSAITYARRYAISAILGISSEDDDDGNHAETISKSKVININKQKVSGDQATKKQFDEMYALVREKDYGKSISSYIEKAYGKKSSKELNKKEVLELIEMLKGM